MSQLLKHVLVPEAETPAMDKAVAEAWLHHIGTASAYLTEASEESLPRAWTGLGPETGDADIPVFECQEEFLRAKEVFRENGEAWWQIKEDGGDGR